MKRHIHFFGILLMLFVLAACKKSSSSSGNNPHAGSWRGTWTQAAPANSGTWTATVDGKGIVSGEDNLGYIISGTVSSSGVWNAKGGTDGGDIFTGNINGNQVTGTWSNPAMNWHGNFSGTKQ